MSSNSVIDEVRRVRAEICARYNNDLDRYAQHISEIEAELRKSGRYHFVDYSTPKTHADAIREESPQSAASFTNAITGVVTLSPQDHRATDDPPRV